MEKNVGGIDRNLRFIVGAILLLAAILSPLGAGWRIAIGVVGAVALITGFTGL